ncbi:hypothetical protein ABIA35_007890 [Catenulispora sp. MAP12-49]|uniref:hypothetical protein n=1 Tax=Catenulispora sp. MAP12-49 TaxID=3156302 RepID=UPI0035153CD4
MSISARVKGAAVLGAALSALAMAPAHADTGASVTVSPSVAAPGAKVTVTLTCPSIAGASSWSTAMGSFSPIPNPGAQAGFVIDFGPPSRPSRPGAPTTFVGTAAAPDRPSLYSVNATCSNGSSGPMLSGSTFLRVGTGGGAAGDGATQQAGTAPGEMALSGVLAGAALALGGVAVRRRRAGSNS